MGDQSPGIVDEKTAEKMTDFIKSAKKAITDVETTLEKKLADSDELHVRMSEEVKGLGDVYAKDKEALSKLADDFAKMYKSNQELRDTVERQQAQLDNPKFSGSTNEKAADFILEAKSFYVEKNKTNAYSAEAAAAFDESRVTDDEIEAYKHIEAVTKKYFLANTDVMSPLDIMTPDEQKAYKHFTAKAGTSGASSFWISPHISSRVIDCDDEIHNYERLFSSEKISRDSALFAVDNGHINGEAKFKCEGDCRKNKLDVSLPGEMEINVHELQGTLCASNKLLEDSQRDVVAYYNKLWREMRIQRLNRAMFRGTGTGEPEGWLSKASGVNRMTMATGQAGHFGWNAIKKNIYNVNTK